MKLYQAEVSPPCRTVRLVADLVGVKFELLEISPRDGDTNTPEFLKMNPQHVVPTLVDDDGYTIWESRAIAKYLVGKYAPNSNLYPTDFYKRLEVDKMLDFDLGTIFRRATDYLIPVFQTGKFDESKMPKLNDAMKILEDILKHSKSGFVASDCLTIADISIITTVTSLQISGYNLDSFPKVRAWLQNVKSAIPAYKTTGENAEHAFEQFLSELLK